jgi:hypothetical protein
MSVEEFLRNIKIDEAIHEINKILGESKKIYEDATLRQTFLRIARAVFLHENSKSSLTDITKIVIEETIDVVIKNQHLFDIKEYTPLSKKGITNLVTTKSVTELQGLSDIIKISNPSILINRTSGYNITNLNNTVILVEQICKDKELYHEETMIKINTGKYTKQQLFEEISDLLNINSKNGNFYTLIYNTISSKVAILSLEEKLLDYDEGTNCHIRDVSSNSGKGLDFKILKIDPLGEIIPEGFSCIQETASIFELNEPKYAEITYGITGNSRTERIQIVENKPIVLSDTNLESITSANEFSISMDLKEYILGFEFSCEIQSVSKFN